MTDYPRIGIKSRGLDDSHRILAEAVNYLLNNMNRDFYLEVSKGNIPGHSSVNKFGTNTDIADGTEEIVWSPSHAYTWSTTADITDIVSSSTSDNGKTIEVQGLDANWDLVVQEKALGTPATTSVTLDTPLIRCFRMRVNDAATNVGNVQCGVGATTTSFTTANLRAQVDAARGQTLMAMYTIPNGKTGYFTKYYGVLVGDNGPPTKTPDQMIWRVYIADRDNGYDFQLKHATAGVYTGTTILQHEFQPPVKVTQKSDIYITANPEGDIGSASAGFDLILVDDGF